MTKVFIVVLNWNRAKDTIDCLNSVFRLRVPSCELNIVVVDNASSDDSIEKITHVSKLETPKHINFNLIRNDENLGFAGGNNVGVKSAMENGADYVLILNNDTIVDANLLIYLIEAAKENPEAAVFTPKIYFESGFEFHKNRYKKTELGRVIWSAGGVIDWKNVYGSNRGVDEVDVGQYNEIEKADFAIGACMFIRIKALERVGIFDEKYFMYFEDSDLSQRIIRLGWKVLYVPKAKVWHKVAQSSRIGSGLNDYFITRNRMLFGLKYAPFRAKFALFRESLKMILTGREWQKKGILDFYSMKFGRGSWIS